MSDCPLCRDGPAYFFDWRCPGCRARWLSTLPSRDWRIQAVNEWLKAGENEMVAQVIERLKQAKR